MDASEHKGGAPPEAHAHFVDLNGTAARAIAAATAQIDLAMREAQDPVESLGQTLERIAMHMSELRAKFLEHTAKCGDANGMLEMDLAVEKLSGEMAMAIQNMQCFDRMFQHLSHVRDYLTSGAETLATSAVASDQEDVEAAAHRWEALRERLFLRLLSDAQRQMLDIVLPPRHWQQGRRLQPRSHSGPGDVELF